MPPRPKRRIRLDNDERRAQLLGLAREAFSARSYDEVSIDDLAASAKISKGLLYHYFPTKRDLYVAGLREIADELIAKLTGLPRGGEPAARMRAGLHAYLEHISQHARAFVSLMRGGIGSDPEVAAVVDGVRQRILELLVEETPFAPALTTDVRFQVSVRGWIGFVEAATIDWAEHQRMTRDELVDLLSDVLGALLPVVTAGRTRAPRRP